MTRILLQGSFSRTFQLSKKHTTEKEHSSLINAVPGPQVLSRGCSFVGA